MSRNERLFSILAAVSAVLALVFSYCQYIYLAIEYEWAGYLYNIYSLISALISVALAIFFFIGKNKVGILVALSLNCLYAIFTCVADFYVLTLFSMLTAIGLLTMAILHIIKVKAIKYLAFIPLVTQVIGTLAYCLRYGFGYSNMPLLTLMYHLHLFFELAFCTFACLFFAFTKIDEKEIQT